MLESATLYFELEAELFKQVKLERFGISTKIDVTYYNSMGIIVNKKLDSIDNDTFYEIIVE